jgi:hypothetical protein
MTGQQASTGKRQRKAEQAEQGRWCRMNGNTIEFDNGGYEVAGGPGLRVFRVSKGSKHNKVSWPRAGGQRQAFRCATACSKVFFSLLNVVMNPDARGVEGLG